jgi:hypothetical protein
LNSALSWQRRMHAFSIADRKRLFGIGLFVKLVTNDGWVLQCRCREGVL